MTDLAIVADIHMRNAQASQITEELAHVLDRLEADPPDHLLVLGDLIEDDESAEIDLANLERVSDLFGAGPCDVTYLLGNHDVENLTRGRLAAELDQKGFYGVVDVDGTPVVYLDSTNDPEPGARGRFGAEQRTWLADVLPELDRPLVCSHHPLGPFDISENVWFKDYPERAFPSDRKETLDVLAGSGPIRGTLSGHIHQTGSVDFRGMAHVSINAFSKELPDKPVTGTYAEVHVGETVTIDTGHRDGEWASYTLQ